MFVSTSLANILRNVVQTSSLKPGFHVSHIKLELNLARVILEPNRLLVSCSVFQLLFADSGHLAARVNITLQNERTTRLEQLVEEETSTVKLVQIEHISMRILAFLSHR